MLKGMLVEVHAFHVQRGRHSSVIGNVRKIEPCFCNVFNHLKGASGQLEVRGLSKCFDALGFALQSAFALKGTV